jgi:hypothetical protein
MDTSKRLNDCVTSLISQIKSFNNLNSLEEKLGEGLSILGDASTLLALTKGIYNFYERNKFEAYLVQLFFKLHGEGEYSKEDEQKFNDYLKNERNIQFIAETIDACFHSHSIKCSAMLDYYAGDYLVNRNDLKYSDLVIINSLKNMFDNDVDNFFKLYICKIPK